ncbi:hypothetical protein D558_0364 [Bordetella holmesii 44057]|nr:hypothetical protein D558_0364 [Bordetella holmesii 44057]
MVAAAASMVTSQIEGEPICRRKASVKALIRALARGMARSR